MKALVTGATGFVGGNLVRELLKQGFQVRVLVRGKSNTRNIDGLDIEVASGDLGDKASLYKALDGCEVLFHVAACYTFWLPHGYKEMYETNVEGTRNILTAALVKGIKRAVYTSSIAALGRLPRGGLGTEETAPAPQDLIGHYQKSKYQAEQVAEEVCRAGLSLVIVNPSAPIGPWDQKPTPTGRITVDYLNRRMPACVNTMLNFIDVEDVAKGHILALEKGKIGQRYILGNKNLSLREVFDILEKVSGIRAPKMRIPLCVALAAAYVDQFVSGRLRGKPPRVPLDGVREACRFSCFDASKAVRELGLPQSPVESAFGKAVAWFREYGYA